MPWLYQLPRRAHLPALWGADGARASGVRRDYGAGACRSAQRLDEIERRVVTAKLPASAAGRLYVLRSHVNFVRDRILQDASKAKAA